MIFNIALEKVVKRVQNTGMGVKVQDLKALKLVAYADDMMLMWKSEGDLMIMAEDLIQKSKQMG